MGLVSRGLVAIPRAVNGGIEPNGFHYAGALVSIQSGDEFHDQKRYVAIVLAVAVGLLLSISCVVGQMEVFTNPLLEAQPIQSGPGSSNSENFALTPALLDTQPIQSGSGSTNAGWTGGTPSWKSD
jgi:hypothetical protein